MKVEIRNSYDNKLISDRVRHISFANNKISSFVVSNEEKNAKVTLRVKDKNLCRLIVNGIDISYDDMTIYKDGKRVTNYPNISDLMFDKDYKMIGFKVRTFENGKEKYFKFVSNRSVFIIVGEPK